MATPQDAHASLSSSNSTTVCGGKKRSNARTTKEPRHSINCWPEPTTMFPSRRSAGRAIRWTLTWPSWESRYRRHSELLGDHDPAESVLRRVASLLRLRGVGSDLVEMLCRRVG